MTELKLNLLLTTYNLNGKTPNADLSDWLNSRIPFTPDVIAISLQEINDFKQDIAFIDDYLCRLYPVKQLAISNLADTTLLLIYVPEKLLEKFGNITIKTIPTTYVLWPVIGGKGAALVSFSFENHTNFCFIGCHLAAHEIELERRNQDYMTIFKQSKSEYENAHFVFCLGDLNYRIDADDSVVRTHSNNAGSWQCLLKFDQLNCEMSKRAAFHFMREPQISFRPTYKFDINRNDYDSSNKLRRPAWTDRILYLEKGINQFIIPLIYSSVEEIQISDHKPVLATFEAILNHSPNNQLPDVKFSREYIEFDNVNYGHTYVNSLLIENLSERPVQVEVCRHHHLSNECLKVDPLKFCMTGVNNDDSMICLRFIFKINYTSAAFLQRTRMYNERIVIKLDGFNFYVNVQAKISSSIFGKCPLQLNRIVMFIESLKMENLTKLQTHERCSAGNIDDNCINKGIDYIEKLNEQEDTLSSISIIESEKPKLDPSIVQSQQLSTSRQPQTSPLRPFDNLCIHAIIKLLIDTLKCAPLPLIDCVQYKKFLQNKHESEIQLNSLEAEKLLGNLVFLCEKHFMTDMLADAAFQHYDEFNHACRLSSIRVLFVHYAESYTVDS
ncbi:hypothetical protein GJ496_006650 [Pomphorhynchus laevis]|nr:hypothetical protein GJ496_006650 [Pomphorhynchus laevis]